ncbi:class I SAM-dependent methyltransferase [Candidatus Dependentiae bacterium]
MGKIRGPRTLLTNGFAGYELVDSGDKFRLERFGFSLIKRYDSTLLYSSHKEAPWKDHFAEYAPDKDGNFSWKKKKQFDESRCNFIYTPPGRGISNRAISTLISLEGSKNVGVFPEQAAHWIWMSAKITKSRKSLNVLNLFGYTGMATMVAAWKGAKVCHVDASQPAITTAKKIQEMSGLSEAPIRWIKDDCTKFVQREVKRKAKYDAIILDPPAFGRDPKGKIFKFENDIVPLLKLVKKVLIAKPTFFIINCYATGIPSFVVRNMLDDLWPLADIEHGELALQESNPVGRIVSCNTYARFSFL